MSKTAAQNDLCPICKSSHILEWGSATDIGKNDVEYQIAKCRDCTHIFVHPLPSKDFLAEAYKNSSSSVLSGSDFYEGRSKGTFSQGDLWVLKHVMGTRAQRNLIDIGSANKRLLSTILELGWKISIVEPSVNIERMSSLKFEEVYRGLFEDCIFERTFDVVCAIDVLEHTHSPIDFLKRTKSILSIRGNALLRFPNSYSLKCRLDHDHWHMIRPLGHLHFFSPRSFRRACKMSQLKIVRMTSHDLDDYRSLSIAGKPVRGMRLMPPVKWFFDKLLLGDQLLVTVTHE